MKVQIFCYNYYTTSYHDELEPTRFYIDTIHRLPSSGHDPRPVIVKCISKLDRDLVWNKKAQLSKSASPVYILKHLDKETEKRITQLLPTCSVAIDMGKKVKLVADKLMIDGKLCTVNNLNDLPPNLSAAWLQKLSTITHFSSPVQYPLAIFIRASLK